MIWGWVQGSGDFLWMGCCQEVRVILSYLEGEKNGRGRCLVFCGLDSVSVCLCSDVIMEWSCFCLGSSQSQRDFVWCWRSMKLFMFSDLAVNSRLAPRNTNTPLFVSGQLPDTKGCFSFSHILWNWKPLPELKVWSNGFLSVNLSFLIFKIGISMVLAAQRSYEDLLRCCI